MGFAKFMSSNLGRIVRIVAGAALIAVGVAVIGGVAGIVVAVIGAVPLLAGLFDVCLIGRLFLGTPLHGTDVRARIEQ